ncbi:cubilin homolog, partial [Teleopsis dalmanni]|uniref:cubilin homolog n=1 Tax=Teleopsis dalmanni TaxID=139649 RepID=UPI0018CD20FF
GKTCDSDVDECAQFNNTDLGCQNNGRCINTPGSYRCECAAGFSGIHCRLREMICEKYNGDELCGHGTCVSANNIHNYTCICDVGWTYTNSSPACVIDINECELHTNPCHSECINMPGSFKCGPCPNGYTGNGITCLDVDECAIDNGGCSLIPKVNCINTEGSYHCGNCPEGWLGDGHICIPAPSNDCTSENICHPKAKCEYISDTVVCTCPVGLSGHGFGENGCKSEIATHPCENHECKNNGTCEVNGEGTRCICPEGYMGATCEKNDACHPNPCSNGGSCKLAPKNKYRCACQRGTTGKNCEIQREICGSVLRQETGEVIYPPEG